MGLLFIDKELEIYMKEAESTRREQYLRLYDQCRLYFNYTLLEDHPQGSTTFMGIASVNLSLMYLLTHQKQYLDEAKRWIFTAVDYEHWGNAHLVDVDLSAAWLLFGLSLSYDWLKNDLCEKEEIKLREKLIIQAERMYGFKKETVGQGWSTAFWQNHNWINHTGLAACGYALSEKYENAKIWVQDAKENFEIVFDSLADDGSDYEGVVYWRYGVIWLMIYAHMLKTEEGLDFYESCNFLKNTFYYRLYQSVPNLQEIMNFGDCHDRRSGHSIAMYYKFAHEYKNEHAQFMAKKVNEFIFREQYESGVKPGILPEAIFEFLWYDPEIKERPFEDLPLVKYFEDLGLLTIRDSWKEDASMLTYKCGAPGGKKQWKTSDVYRKEKNWMTRGLSHQHTDNNAFILHSNNAYLAIDDGYNRTVKACEHNVVIVDGKGYVDEGQNNVWKNIKQDEIGEIKSFYNSDKFVHVLGECSKSYDKDLEFTWFGRNIIYTGSKFFIIIDELKSSIPHTYSWIMHSDVTPIQIEENVYEFTNGPAKMKLYNIASADTNFILKDTYVKAIMTTQEPDKFRETNMKSIVIENTQPTKNLSFLSILLPESSFKDYDIAIEKLCNDDVLGCIIRSAASKEIFLVSKGKLINEIVLSDANWVYIKYEKTKIAEIKAFDGTFLEFGGQKYELEKEKITAL